MATIDTLVLDGRVTLFALAVLVLEMIVLVVVTRRRSVSSVLSNGLAGIFLILALRAALLGPDATSVAIWLGFGLIAHLADLVLRLRR